MCGISSTPDYSFCCFECQNRRDEIKAGERVWVVNASYPIHRGGQCPPRNGFSDFRARGQLAGGGVTPLGHRRQFPLVR